MMALDKLVTGDFSAPDCHPRSPQGPHAYVGPAIPCPGPLPIETSSNGMCPSPFSIPVTPVPGPVASSAGWSPPESVAVAGWEPSGPLDSCQSNQK